MLKEALVSTSILKLLDFSLLFNLETETSNFMIGTMLS